MQFIEIILGILNFILPLTEGDTMAQIQGIIDFLMGLL